MQGWDWTPYLVGGGTRPDAMTGLQEPFRNALTQMFMAAPEDVRNSLRIMSAYRSPEIQAQLWQAALDKYGSPEAARKWVAPPGNSFHNKGLAVDFSYLDPSAREWAHANAGNFNLHFPMSWEPWHIEYVGTRDGVVPVAVPDAPGDTYAAAAPQGGGMPPGPQMTAQNALSGPYDRAGQMPYRRRTGFQLDPADFMRPTNALRYA